MNKIIFQHTAFLLGLAAFTSVGHGLSAQATPADTGIKGAVTQPVTESNVTALNLESASVASQNPTNVSPELLSEVVPAAQDIASTPDFDSVAPLNSTQLPDERQPLHLQTAEVQVQTDNLMLSEEPLTLSDESVEQQPVPGTTQTSATQLSAQSVSEPSATPPTSDASLVAQDVPLNPAIPGANYLGVGGGLGLTGETALGDLGFAIISKLRLTRLFSFRPAVVISGDVDFLLPITYDFPVETGPFERINFAPYLGAGATITSSGSNFGGLLTGGVDIPISRQFTANASLNLNFTGSSVGLGFIFGLGYNFGPGFFNFD